MTTIINKDKSRRILQQDNTSHAELGKILEGDNYLVSASGKSLVPPKGRPTKKEKLSFTERKELKEAKTIWKDSVLRAFPTESGSANEIIKRHYQIDQKF